MKMSFLRRPYRFKKLSESPAVVKIDGDTANALIKELFDSELGTESQLWNDLVSSK